MKKLFGLIILVPIGVALVALCVANRQSVTLALNPFEPADRLLSLTAPFFAFLFAALIVGLVLGSCATWLSQGRYRRRARNQASEAVKWQAEADRHKSRAEKMAAQTLIPAPQKAA